MKSLLNDDTAQYLQKVDYTSTWSVAHHMRFLMFAHFIVHNQFTTVLDVGFGQNMLVKYLKGAGFKGKYVGIDMNPDYVIAAKHELEYEDMYEFQLDYRVGGVSDLAGNEQFDCIVLGEVIEHVPLDSALKFMAECKMHLSFPWGAILMSTPNRLGDAVNWPDDHDHEFSLPELLNLAETAEYRVAEKVGLWNNTAGTYEMLDEEEKKKYTDMEMLVPNSILNVMYNVMHPEKSKAVLLVLTHKPI